MNNILSTALAVSLAAILAACTAPVIHPQSRTPTCRSKAECDVRMRAAASWMHLHLKRYVLEQTPELVQTRMDTSPGDYLVMRVTKVPEGDGVHRINAEIWCAKRTGCSVRPWDALQRFNRFVNSAWKVVDMPDHADADEGSATRSAELP